MKQDNQSKILLLGVSSAALDEAANEIYIADGYLNRRVTVFDLKTGAFKRGWGAYGKPISEISNDPQPAHDPNDLHAADFKSPVHCVRISNDGLVYVCDRAGDRVQVFTKDGKFVKEFHVVNADDGQRLGRFGRFLERPGAETHLRLRPGERRRVAARPPERRDHRPHQP